MNITRSNIISFFFFDISRNFFLLELLLLYIYFLKEKLHRFISFSESFPIFTIYKNIIYTGRFFFLFFLSKNTLSKGINFSILNYIIKKFTKFGEIE